MRESTWDTQIGGNTAHPLFSFSFVFNLFSWISSGFDQRISEWHGMHLAQGALGKLDRVGVLAYMHDRWGQICLSVVTWGWKAEQVVYGGGGVT